MASPVVPFVSTAPRQATPSSKSSSRQSSISGSNSSRSATHTPSSTRNTSPESWNKSSSATPSINSEIKAANGAASQQKPRPSKESQTKPEYDRPRSLPAMTSTPLAAGISSINQTPSSNTSQMSETSSSHSPLTLDNELTASGTQTDLDLSELLEVPILGYEVMEQRAKFTVFKLRVQKGPEENWFLFRRYSDFVRLNDRLEELFPHFRLALPPKKWFGDNFDREFLEDRVLGLQAFINNIVGHRDVCKSEPVRQFLCIDESPGPHDSLEESRALCESLEEQVYTMKQELQARDAKISLLEDEVAIYRQEVDQLRNALRLERSMTQDSSPSQQPSESSLTEQEQTEADQGALCQQLQQPHSTPANPSPPGASCAVVTPDGAITSCLDNDPTAASCATANSGADTQTETRGSAQHSKPGALPL